ncbi:MAG TPA: TonB-dependent receptor plug domain-containing protein [Opitutaceae bacterium]|nr:TonB-dependent receptor plug domain-containing protein [Opitutaceae bacterium]
MALFGASIAAAQTAAPASASPADLARYDRNHNGQLDPDELAARDRDRAKTAGAAQAAKPDSSQNSDVVQLSPFEVSGDDDKGYAASSTLAGTRLNSKLEDIAGSVSVVTKQQLIDTAAIDINDIFSYEVGTEGTNEFTDLTNDGRGDYDNVAGNPTGANRMRGLSSANIAVGGFTASSTIPIDTYNVAAVEIARGPNSNLAGLSDAGGTVNLVTSTANTTRESSNAQFRGDSYGGFRTSVDLNRPIVRNKLSVRFSAVYNETGYVRKPSVDRTNRQQIAVTYRPFHNTTINGSFEWFHEFAQRANSITPRDTITPWKAAGSPTWDPVSRTYFVNGVRSAPITNTNLLPAGLSGLGSSNARILQYIDDGQIAFMMRGANTANATLGQTTMQQFLQSSNASLAGPLYKIPGTTDKSIYDWTSVNMAASGYESQSARIANLTINQGLLATRRNRLDLNLAWRREDQDDYRRMFIGQQDGVGTTLEVDVNEKLLDGRPNPFFLHPFIGGVNPQVYQKPVFNDNYRWQLAYQLDLRHESNLLKWLGLHRAIGYQEYQLNIQSPNGLRYHDIVTDNLDFQPALASPTATTNVTGNAGALFYPLYYFGKTPGGGVEYANTGPVNPNGKYVASFASATSMTRNLADPVTIDEVYFAIGQQKKKTRTTGATIQSYFFNDALVTTFGKRRDKVYTSDNFPLALDDGFYDTTNLYNFGLNKRWRMGDTDTEGFVLKPFRNFSYLRAKANESAPLPRFLAQTLLGFSFYRNKSNSFKPADTAYNLFLQELPNPIGETEEYGFGLNMFDNRFSLRLTHQETQQTHTRAGTGVIATRVLGLDFHPGGQDLSFNLYDAATGWEQALHPNYSPEQAQAAAAKRIGYTPEYIADASGKTISDVNDATSKGWELELQFNPNRYFTMKVTGNQQEAIDSNVSLFIQQYIDQRLPLWTTIRFPTELLPDGTQLPNAGQLWWETSQGSNRIPRDYFTGNVQTPLNLAITTQGKKKPQTREYRISALTKFQLAAIAGDHKWLRNMAVGGAYRWASKGAIGYLAGPPDSDGVVRTLDRTKPFYDKPVGNIDVYLSYSMRLFRDRVRANFQLNVKNITESGHLQGVAVNPDGQFWQYRIIDPRQFILSASFDL